MLRVISLSTDDNNLVKNFEKTAQYFGYEYYFVGRGKSFQGWPWRTNLYISAIERLGKDPKDIFILCDSNDLFFVAPSDEMKEKFINSNKNCLIGAEAACCNGKYGDRKFRNEALESCKKRNPNTRYMFPNGGFLIGYRDELLKLLNSNKTEWDDQGGYLQKFMDKSPLLDINISQSLVGNVPTINEWYHVPGDEYGKPEITYWNYSEENNRFKNIFSGEYPCAFHFPGKSYSPYNIVTSKMFSVEPGNPNTILLPYNPQTSILLKSTLSKEQNQTLLIFLIIIAVLILAVGVTVLTLVLLKRSKFNK